MPPPVPGGGSILDRITVDPVPLRSATERRLVDAILKSEGQWDPDTQVFLTRERVLQERSRCLSKLHQTLRMSPQVSYDHTAKAAADRSHPAFLASGAAGLAVGSSSQPPSAANATASAAGATKLALSMASVLSYRAGSSAGSGGNLDMVDPNPQNVERRRVAAEITRRDMAARLHVAPAGGALAASPLVGAGGRERVAASTLADTLTSLESDLLVAAEQACASTSVSARSTPAVGVMSSPLRAPGSGPRRIVSGSLYPPESSSTQRQPRAGVAPPSSNGAFPEVKEGDTGYSSLLMQLLRTRGEVESLSKNQSTLRTILSLDAHPDLKRTITKMFADPKNAEKISQEEHDRREKRFEDERKAQLTHQLALLAEERAIMAREMASMGSNSLTGGGGGGAVP